MDPASEVKGSMVWKNPARSARRLRAGKKLGINYSIKEELRGNMLRYSQQ
jgi:hypothetical protein